MLVLMIGLSLIFSASTILAILLIVSNLLD